jgi:hypothetical protein
MAKIGALTNLDTLQNSSVIAAVNSNNTVLTTALNNTLSLDGSSPNQMSANLDLNSHHIINLPVPATSTEPIRLGDVNSLANPGPYTVSTLPSPTLGMLAFVTDGTGGLAWGATVTGGASTKYLVWYNGSNWTVIGK